MVSCKINLHLCLFVSAFAIMRCKKYAKLTHPYYNYVLN